LAGAEGAALVFDKVLLVDKDGDVTVGAPTVEGAQITGKIVAHVRGEKVLVFKKKRRKTYQKMNGHRQDLTKVLIESISLK
jgi:large subunit ribosomal protein L21